MMTTSNPLRSAITQNMWKLGYNFAVLSEKSDIHRGTLSMIFVGGNSRISPMSFHHLTKISRALELPEDAFFNLYVDECFFCGKPNWSRIEPFLERCIEMGYPDFLEKVLHRLKGEPRYLPLLFQLAERQQKEETKPLTERLYEYVLAHNRDRHSDEKAICHYRLFLFELSEDEENNFRALNAFLPYRDNLPYGLKLESLIVMGNLCYNRMDTEALENVADELIALCLHLFGTEEHPPDKPFKPDRKLERPAAVYYGHGYMMKQIALSERNEYQEAEACSSLYESLGWLAGSEDGAEEAVSMLRRFAHANRVGCRLLAGDLDALPAYIRLLEAYPKETVSGLIVLLKTATRCAISVDPWLRRFPLDLQKYLDLQDDAGSRQLSRNRFARLLYQLAIYHFSRGRLEESLQAALQSCELSHQLNNHRMFRLLSSLTLMYSGQAEPTEL
ncbi:hypothetical protein [Saccharibacillus alkalitolerans]|uniref:HTH cro/C1-type domain-containing protein n=1 Tax=Saccharibacillus alkalitolerans TaxID=2705290 RepID=A0ABX0F7C2_9BACL|nr:hypothetical protein [Saccharibacillus alkalitolerans]NGZ76213.1 hypothetical protein [Saccharibacillus alkalitolerans]